MVTRLIPLTDAQKANLLENYPTCPVCGDDLEQTVGADPEGTWFGAAYLYSTCSECGVNLREEYRLVNAMIIDREAP